MLALFNCYDLWPEWMLGYEPASRRDDRHGVDVWIDTQVGKIKLQIKSSFEGARAFSVEHPDIPVVIIRPEMTQEEIVSSCVSAIFPTYKYYLDRRNGN